MFCLQFLLMHRKGCASVFFKYMFEWEQLNEIKIASLCRKVLKPPCTAQLLRLKHPVSQTSGRCCNISKGSPMCRCSLISQFANPFRTSHTSMYMSQSQTYAMKLPILLHNSKQQRWQTFGGHSLIARHHPPRLSYFTKPHCGGG